MTDRDIVTRALAEGKDINPCLVKDIATKHPITCSADLDIEEAAQLFAEHQIHRILVVDKNGTPVGLLSVGDLQPRQRTTNFIASKLRKVKEGVTSAKVTPRVSQEEKPTEIMYET